MLREHLHEGGYRVLIGLPHRQALLLAHIEVDRRRNLAQVLDYGA